MLHRAKVLAAIGFDDDNVAFLDEKASIIEQVEDVYARAFETDNVELFAWTVWICAPKINCKQMLADIYQFTKRRYSL